MTGRRKGILLGAVQLALVLSLGGKLLYDRETRPRVWVLAQVYDPELPIRGRYLAESLRMPVEGFTYTEPQKNTPYWQLNREWAYLEIENNQLIAKRVGNGPGQWVGLRKNNDGTISALSEEPVLVFVPEHFEAPTLKSGQELWVEVTVPAKGPPRPIRIGIKKDGAITPLSFN